MDSCNSPFRRDGPPFRSERSIEGRFLFGGASYTRPSLAERAAHPQGTLTMPSVLFISRVFPPASGATGQLLSDLVTELRNVGWSVEVICDGTVRNSRPGMLRRLLLYLALYPKFFLRALRLPKADVIVTMTDPPLQIVLGTAISLLKGSRHVHWAQDIYPELAEELGVLRKGGLLA